MTSPLETRYRSLLRWYPRSWRLRNADAFVGTMLDVADAQGRDEATPAEVGSIVRHGVEARLDRIVEPRVRRAGSTVALTMGTGLAVGSFAMGKWAPWAPRVPQAAAWPADVADLGSWSFVIALVWAGALVAGVAGRWTAGRAVLALGVVFTVVAALLPDVFEVDRPTAVFATVSAVIAITARPAARGLTALAALGWTLLVALVCAVPPGATYYPGPGVLWQHVGAIWYAAGAAMIVGVGLAIARLWRAAFVVTIGLVPVAVTFVVARAIGDLYENGSSLVIALPVALGVLLLVLHSSGRLTLGRLRASSAARVDAAPASDSPSLSDPGSPAAP